VVATLVLLVAFITDIVNDAMLEINAPEFIPKDLGLDQGWPYIHVVVLASIRAFSHHGILAEVLDGQNLM
jgi:hypothetical protein